MLYVLMGIAAAFCAFIQWGDEVPLPNFSDLNKQEAEYVHNVNKKEVKDKYERIKFDRKPTGYMTVEEYEILSAPKDRMTVEIEVPKQPTPADMVYVPQPAYKIVKYNNPPGGTEISLNKSFYIRRQQNAQGIVSPDFSKLIYPTVYYYPDSASTACDLFVINLEDAQSNMHKILTANIIHRLSDPILSTDKNIDNYFTFRTLTPVDFSVDGTKLLVKEKIGNTKDGIWRTTPVVYDFNTGVSYNIVEIRDAISYYWEENRGINLDEKRWDIYPLGFDANNPEWIIVNAYAYTGAKPINLGIWTVHFTGEQSRLVSFEPDLIDISMNGYKLVKSGIVSPSVTEIEQKQLERIEKENAKLKKKQEKDELKALDASYKAKIKEMDAEFKEAQKDYALRQKIQGSTSGNEIMIKYNEIKAKNDAKEQKRLQKLKEKELKRLQKEQNKQKSDSN